MSVSLSNHRTWRARIRLRKLLGSLVLITILLPLSGLLHDVLAVGTTVTIDNFNGTTFGTRTVTALPLPNTSTTPQGTFSQSNGIATMTMSGSGNGDSGTELSYTSGATDMTGGGNNTQFLLQLAEVNQIPPTGQFATGVTLSVSVTGSNGVVATSGSIGAGNYFAYNVAIPFSMFTCSANCTKTLSWSSITGVSIMFLYPTTGSGGGSLTVEAQKLWATPTGGAAPAVPSPSVTTPSTSVAGPLTTTIPFTVSFTSGGNEAPVTYSPPSNTGVRAQDLSVTGTAFGAGTPIVSVSGGPATYTVNVSGLKASGTVILHVPAGIVEDAWNQANTASSGDPTVNYTEAIPPSFTTAASATASVGSTFIFTAGAMGGSPPPTPVPTMSESGALPSGILFADKGNGTATLSGPPATGTGGVYPISITAKNIAGTVNQNFTLTVDEAPSILSSSTATVTTGSSQTIQILTGHSYPATTSLQVTSGSIPTGMILSALSGSNATISGIPTVGGVYHFNLTASNGSSTAVQALTITVDEAPTIKSASATTMTTSQASTFTITTGTMYPTPPTLTETGSLPSGILFTDKGNGTATLAGTPGATSGGVYNVTITASNGVNPPAQQSFVLTVDEPPTITSGSSALFTAGTAGSFAITLLPGAYPAPTLGYTGSLPGGLTMSTPGTSGSFASIDGTALTGTGGQYAIHLTVSSTSGTATATLGLTVDEAPTIKSASTTTMTAGTASTFTITTGGYPTPALTTTGTLPSGVTFLDNGDGTATLAGTPAAGAQGPYPLTITAANGIGSAAIQSFSLIVDAAPTITSAASSSFGLGTAGTFTITTAGYPAPALTEVGSLPTGVSFTDNGNGTATISGTPAAMGSFSITIGAANGVGVNASQAFILSVDAAPTITSPSSATVLAGTAAAIQITTALSYPKNPALTELGTLPQGLSFTDNGNGTATLAGTPAAGAGGTYTLTFTATSTTGFSTTQTFKLTVHALPVFTGAATVQGTSDRKFTYTISTSDAFPSNVTLTELGQLPSGTSFTDNGNGTATIAGTIRKGTSGTYPVTITADNGLGTTVSETLTLTIVGEPTTISISAIPPSVPAGSPVTFTITVTPAPSGGTVTLYDPGVPVAGCINIPVNPTTGIATCTTTSLAAGSDVVTATFNGSTGYASATTALGVTVAVQAASIVPVPGTGSPLPVLPSLLSLLSGVALLMGRRWLSRQEAHHRQ